MGTYYNLEWNVKEVCSVIAAGKKRVYPKVTAEITAIVQKKKMDQSFQNAILVLLR